MRALPSLGQIAHAIWNLVALASRTVTASVVSDKTGYSLTAGSYSPIKSIQNGSTTITATNTTADSTITAVVTGKAFILVRDFGDGSGGTNAGDVQIINSTTVRYTRSSSSGSSTAHWTVVEWH